MNLEKFLEFEDGLLIFTQNNNQFQARIKSIKPAPPIVIINFRNPVPVGHRTDYVGAIFFFIFNPDQGIALTDEEKIAIELHEPRIPRWGKSFLICKFLDQDRAA